MKIEPAPNTDIVLRIIEDGEDLPSRSSSADLLDAFEFFDPKAIPNHPPPPEPANLLSPTINIISASTENLASDDEMNFIVTVPTTTEKPANSIVMDLDPFGELQDNKEETETESDTDSTSESGSAKLVGDDMDFDEIMSRPPASVSGTKVQSASDVWQNTEDSGIGGEFRATFSVRSLNLFVE